MRYYSTLLFVLWMARARRRAIIAQSILHFPHPQREQAWREGLGPIGSDMTRLRFMMLQLMEGSSVSTKNNQNSEESVEALGLE